METNETTNPQDVEINPTPAEIAKALEIIAKAKKSEDATNATGPSDLPVKSQETDAPTQSSSKSENNPSPTEDEGIIDPVRKRKLEALFAESINNPRFWTNEKRVERLEQALNIPEYDDRSLQQFAVSAKEELIKEAMEYAIANNQVPVMPSKEEIRARAEEKYEEKLAKAKKKTKRAKEDTE